MPALDADGPAAMDRLTEEVLVPGVEAAPEDEEEARANSSMHSSSSQQLGPERSGDATARAKWVRGWGQGGVGWVVGVGSGGAGAGWGWGCAAGSP